MYGRKTLVQKRVAGETSKHMNMNEFTAALKTRAANALSIFTGKGSQVTSLMS